MPQVELGSGFGVGLEDAVALPPGPQLALAPARAAGVGEGGSAADDATARSDANRMAVGVAAARVVSPAEPVSTPAPVPTPAAPESEPAIPPTPVPVAAPIVTPTSAPQPGPVATPPAKHTASDGGRVGGPSAVGALGGLFAAPGEPIELGDGDELALAFYFYVEPIAYRLPGEENSILRLKDDTGEPLIELQLWDDGGEQRGLWISGEAAGGERFLGPLDEGEWHRAVLYFRAASDDEGFYLLLLDGEPVDARGLESVVG